MACWPAYDLLGSTDMHSGLTWDKEKMVICTAVSSTCVQSHRVSEVDSLGQGQHSRVWACIDWPRPAGVDIDGGDGDNLVRVSSVMGPKIDEEVRSCPSIIYTMCCRQHVLIADEGSSTQESASYVEIHNPWVLIWINLIATKYSTWLVGNSTITCGAAGSGCSCSQDGCWGAGCRRRCRGAVCGVVVWRLTPWDVVWKRKLK